MLTTNTPDPTLFAIDQAAQWANHLIEDVFNGIEFNPAYKDEITRTLKLRDFASFSCKILS